MEDWKNGMLEEAGKRRKNVEGGGKMLVRMSWDGFGLPRIASVGFGWPENADFTAKDAKARRAETATEVDSGELMVDSNRALRDSKLALTLNPPLIPLPRGEGNHLAVLFCVCEILAGCEHI